MEKYLSNNNFLKDICSQKQRDFFVKITALSQNETPLEEIQGMVSGGQINIDGASAVRRTCSLTLVAQLKNNKKIQGENLSSQYWGLNTKFSLQIGIKNNLSNWQEYKSNEIIWFPMGIFLISTFNISYSATNLTINIAGKDKMCQLNGDLGGVISATTNFGEIEEYDLAGIKKRKKLPVKQIIREMIHSYANEPYSKIIIEDITDYGLNLETYRGNIPMYFFLSASDVSTLISSEGIIGEDINSLAPINYTFDGKCNVCQKNGDTITNLYTLATVPDDLFIHDDLQGNDNAAIFYIHYDTADIGPFNIRKIQYGDTVGYKLTDLTYPGDLVANGGETISSVLNKIKTMLGNYEYFYDLSGNFIFRKQRAYQENNTVLDTSGNSIISLLADKDDYIDFTFDNSELITSVSRNPNINNLKNDFTVWGNKTVGTNNSSVPIHLRYAIDKKPLRYTAIRITEERARMLVTNYPQLFVNNSEAAIKKLQVEHPGTSYVAKNLENISYQADKEVDWRELIYQMALDYRQFNQVDEFSEWLAENNDWVIEGKTGYEQYYTDLEGFWRDLYHAEEGVTMNWYDKFKDGKSYKIHFCDTDNYHISNGNLFADINTIVNAQQTALNSEIVSGNLIITRFLKDMKNLLTNIPITIDVMVSTYQKYLLKIKNYLELFDFKNSISAQENIDGELKKVIMKEEQYTGQSGTFYELDESNIIYEVINPINGNVYYVKRIPDANNEESLFSFFYNYLYQKKLESILGTRITGEEKTYQYNISRLTTTDNGQLINVPNYLLYKYENNNYTPIGYLYDIIKTNYDILKRQIERLAIEDIRRASAIENSAYSGLYETIKEAYPEAAVEDALYFKDPKTVVLDDEGYMVKPQDSSACYHAFQSIYLRQSKDGTWQPSFMSATRNNRLFTSTGEIEIQNIKKQYKYLGEAINPLNLNSMIERVRRNLNKISATPLDGKGFYFDNISTFCHGVEDTYFEWFLKKADSYFSLGFYYPLDDMQIFIKDEETDNFQNWSSTLHSILQENNMCFKKIIQYRDIWNVDGQNNTMTWTDTQRLETNLFDSDIETYLGGNGRQDYNQRLFVLRMLLFQFPELITTLDDTYNSDGWNIDIFQNPENLKFWLDFLDTNGELDKYSVPIVGQRAKIVNDTAVKAIKYPKVMQNIFLDLTDEVTNTEEKIKEYFKSIDLKSNYVHYNLGTKFSNFLTISARNKDAFTTMSDLLYNYAHCAENISVNCIPLLFLEPNSKFNIYNYETEIDGIYILSKISFSFGHTATMSLTATKAIENNIIREDIMLS